MLMTVAEFRTRITTDRAQLIQDLQDHTGRYGKGEHDAWNSSLPMVAEAFSAKSLQPLHLFFEDRGALSLEYRLPASSSWCDMVLLGEHDGQPAGVMVELKHWLTEDTRPGSVEGLVTRHGGQRHHPADQVRGYVEYCRGFHSTVQARNAAIHGCVLFTRDHQIGGFLDPPNDRLVADYPCFTLRPHDVDERLPRYFQERLTAPNEDFAREFESGRYVQDRSFCIQIGEQILDPESTPFVLLDKQRFAFSRSLAEVTRVLGFQKGEPTKKVVIIKGPPGSGKSVIAARLWAELVRRKSLPEQSVVLTTTSVSQNSNWRGLFAQVAKSPRAKGVIKKATEYVPITTHDVGEIRRKYPDITLEDPAHWREHLSVVRDKGYGRDRLQDNEILISIVDEAHALINPEYSDARGQFGFAVAGGPPGYHIIRSSVVSIFLMDPEQSFRERETTTIEDIVRWAEELGAEPVTEVSLEGAQFRCGGMAEYTDWVEKLIRGDSTEDLRRLVPRWRLPAHVEGKPRIATGRPAGAGKGRRKPAPRGLTFELVETPADLEDRLRDHASDGSTVRLLASYARKWKTRNVASPHKARPSEMDFNIPYSVDGRTRHWSKPWNFVPQGQDYTAFIQGSPGFPMAEDPLCEVGCPYAVRGFDFDYVGVLWLSDLVYRSGEWVIQLEHVHETGLKPYLRRASTEEDANGEHHRALLQKVGQAYRILLTRAIHGIYLWVEDDETRGFIAGAMGA
jgi:DUF2075 family protein